MDRGHGQREKSPVRELMGKKGQAVRWGKDDEAADADRELNKYRDESGKIPELVKGGHEYGRKGAAARWGKDED